MFTILWFHFVNMLKNVHNKNRQLYLLSVFIICFLFALSCLQDEIIGPYKFRLEDRLQMNGGQIVTKMGNRNPKMLYSFINMGNI